MDKKLETKLEAEDHFALLKFGAEWCSYTRIVACQIAELKSYFPHVDFIFYNLRYDYPVFQKYNVETLPTVILLRNGREIKRYDGCSPYLLEEMLNMTVRR